MSSQVVSRGEQIVRLGLYLGATSLPWLANQATFKQLVSATVLLAISFAGFVFANAYAFLDQTWGNGAGPAVPVAPADDPEPAQLDPNTAPGNGAAATPDEPGDAS